MDLPFDAFRRTRIYLVRHGEASSSAGKGDVYGDSIALTPRGVEEAKAMGAFLANVHFDAAYCSTIDRARETAGFVLHGRDITPIYSDRFKEIQGDFAGLLARELPPQQLKAAFAYNVWEAGQPDARFFTGERFVDFIGKVGETMLELVRPQDAGVKLIVAHSGFLRAALTWALDAGPVAMAAFEQDSCALNILDIDVDAHGAVARKHVRLANFTPMDPQKAGMRLTNGEEMASRLFDHVHGAGRA